MPFITRIFSDIHFGDRASRVRRLTQLQPLLDGVDALVLNGDTLDTRPGPPPAATAELRAETLGFFRGAVPMTTFVTGNHDADLSPQHSAELAGGRVFAIHGDILFENIVPWSADAPLIGREIAHGLGVLAPDRRDDLTARLALWRHVAARVPQRHQSERHGLKYLLRFAADTVWPPLRILRILRAWQEEPRRATTLLRQHRPAAQVLLAGHTHRPGCWRLAHGAVLINTGSFCPPFGGFAVDVLSDRVLVRRVMVRQDEFRLGSTVAEFPLAET